mmetsp:Transcript_74066/g.199705  ORF Transcript_74066/g.199705 Transcript_74066/m.199705 type:complete len:236 (+) Transcript_74066:3-710(+)
MLRSLSPRCLVPRALRLVLPSSQPPRSPKLRARPPRLRVLSSRPSRPRRRPRRWRPSRSRFLVDHRRRLWTARSSSWRKRSARWKSCSKGLLMGRRWRNCSTTRSPSLTSCGKSWRSSSSSSRRSACWSCRRRRPNWRRQSGSGWNVNGLRNGCSPNAARKEKERKGEKRTSLARPETRSCENWCRPWAAAAAAADAATPVVAATWAPWFRCRLALALGRSRCTPCRCRPEPLEP